MGRQVAGTPQHEDNHARQNNHNASEAGKGCGVIRGHGSAESDLGEDALAGEQLGGQANDEAEHGQATIPGFSESDETEAGGGISHGC